MVSPGKGTSFATASRYWSESEYQVKKGQEAAIIRAAAYHRKDFDLAVVWFSPNDHLAVQDSLSAPFSRITYTTLGSLRVLPLELISHVCRQLDLRSLVKFSQVNLQARRVVMSLREYQMMVLYGLNPFRALLQLRLGCDVTAFDFYKAMKTKNCAFCGDFGGFVFLPTWTRCCFECLQHAPKTRIITYGTVQKLLSVKKPERLQIGVFRPIIGPYAMTQRRLKSHARLVSVERVELASKHGMHDIRRDWQEALEPDHQPPSKYSHRYMASCALPFFDVRTGAVERGLCCAGCLRAINVRIVEWRKDSERALHSRDKVHSEEQFLEHFKWCQQAQLLYDSSAEGTVEPLRRPLAADRGGFFALRE